jgi:hypothetical protein
LVATPITEQTTLTFTPGETSKTITILVNGDRAPEPNKTFLGRLTNLNYGVIADSQGAGTRVSRRANTGEAGGEEVEEEEEEPVEID